MYRDTPRRDMRVVDVCVCVCILVLCVKWNRVQSQTQHVELWIEIDRKSSRADTLASGEKSEVA